MANRPGNLAELEHGKSIYSANGFVDTWNWIVSCMKNLKGGRGIKVQWPSDDTPEISIEGGADNLLPNFEGGGEVTNAVYDVDKSYNPTSGNDELTISYTDEREDKTIELPAGGDLSCTFTGTDATYTSGTEFTFESADDSNVTVNCSNGVFTIGVYYS